MKTTKKVNQTHRVSKVAQILAKGLMRHVDIEDDARETTCNSGQPERSWSNTETENR